MRQFTVVFLGAAALLQAQSTVAAGTARTAQLAFEVTTPRSSGTLAEQVREGIDQLSEMHPGVRVVKIRAFVAGSAEAAQVPGVVASAYVGRVVPVVSVIRVGNLEHPSSQIVMEFILETGTVQNPNGLVFVSGQLTTAPQAPQPAAVPLAERSLANLKAALAGMQVEPAAVLRVTCFASTLVDQVQVRAMIRAQFAKAALNLMQIQKDPENQEVECEAVARLSKAPSGPVQLVNPNNAAFAQAALVNAPEVIFTTTHTGTGTDDAVRTAFRALDSTLQAAGASMDTVFYAYAYPVNATLLQKYRDVRFEFLKREKAPASTNLAFEGVMTPGHTLGVDVIALPR